jgi:hypothetical protein
MFLRSSRYSILFKAMALAIVCAFLFNDIAWAMPSGYNPPEQATLATESQFNRITLLFKELDFKTKTYVISSTLSLKGLLVDQGVLSDEKITNIKREINRLNRLFPGGALKINEDVALYNELNCSKRKYHSVVFNFKEKINLRVP